MKWDWWEKRDLGLVFMVDVGIAERYNKIYREREERESMLMEDDEMLFVFSKTKLKGIFVMPIPMVRKPSKFLWTSTLSPICTLFNS